MLRWMRSVVGGLWSPRISAVGQPAAVARDASSIADFARRETSLKSELAAESLAANCIDPLAADQLLFAQPDLGNGVETVFEPVSLTAVDDISHDEVAGEPPQNADAVAATGPTGGSSQVPSRRAAGRQLAKRLEIVARLNVPVARKSGVTRVDGPAGRPVAKASTKRSWSGSGSRAVPATRTQVPRSAEIIDLAEVRRQAAKPAGRRPGSKAA